MIRISPKLSSKPKLPCELAAFTLLSEWDRAESDARRARRAVDELARSMAAKGRG